MAIQFLILVLCSLITVFAVRMLVMTGIASISNYFGFTSKTRGQIIGYTTSLPEFVIVIAAGLSGVFDAGFWNIASSNIINLVLFMSAILAYRQHKDLLTPHFLDEIIFGALSIVVPLVLFRFSISLNLWVSLALLLFFVVYKVLDIRLNAESQFEEPECPEVKNIWLAFGAILLGLIVVVVAGRFLGNSAHALIVGLNTSAWLVGWILGFITSLPEMVSFFEVYRIEKANDRLDQLHGTQQALDALVSSNMSNLGVILPIGAIIAILVQ